MFTKFNTRCKFCAEQITLKNFGGRVSIAPLGTQTVCKKCLKSSCSRLESAKLDLQKRKLKKA
jgi:hypothetical protein